jgi:hypothetical protein
MPFARHAVSHPPRSLVLVNRPLWQDPADLQEIVMRVRDRAPEILPILVQEGFDPAKLPPAVWEQPVLTVSFAPLERFRPPRGAVLQGRPIPKLEQYRMFLDAGLPGDVFFPPLRRNEPISVLSLGKSEGANRQSGIPGAIAYDLDAPPSGSPLPIY